MDQLQIRCAKDANDTCVVHLEGPLTLSTLFEFQNVVRNENSGGLIIVLEAVPYMDSAGLGAILGAYASCQRHGRQFALAGVSSRVLTLLQVAKVDALVPRYANVEAAQADWKVTAAKA
jgi:anti-anti-sigma factor